MNYDQNQVAARMEHLAAQRRYSNGRINLMLVVIMSVVNLITIVVANTYFVFSSYITQIFAYIGMSFYISSGGQVVWPVIFGLLGLLSIVPYVLCFIFSKKKKGWLIAAAVIFIIDSLVLLIDAVPGVMAGDISMILDVVLHGYVLYSLISALKNAEKALAPVEEDPIEAAFAEQAVTEGQEGFEVAFAPTRTVTVTREKKFTGALGAMTVTIDGAPVATLSNGETVNLQVNTDGHAICVVSADQSVVSQMLEIPAGDMNKSYSATFKTGALKFSIIFQEIA